MDFLYPFFISFSLIFFAELGDKTQLLVLSFSTKNKIHNILLGVAIGTFFSHGLAILFGSKISSFTNDSFQFYLKFLTYSSFILFGILGFIPERETSKSSKSKFSFLKRLSNFALGSIIVISLSIVVGEFGDKTFLASLGLGVEYSSYKFSLICGSIFGMVFSNLIAIFCGKFLSRYLKPSFISVFSNILFLIFGFFGFCKLFCIF